MRVDNLSSSTFRWKRSLCDHTSVFAFGASAGRILSADNLGLRFILKANEWIVVPVGTGPVAAVVEYWERHSLLLLVEDWERDRFLLSLAGIDPGLHSWS